MAEENQNGVVHAGEAAAADANNEKKEPTLKQRRKKYRASAKKKLLLTTAKGFVSSEWSVIGKSYEDGLKPEVIVELIKENYDVTFSAQELEKELAAKKKEVDARKAKKAAKNK